MKICRRLAGSCRDEKEFYRKNRRGCFYAYVGEHYGFPDLSVMKSLSSEDYPYFIAAAAVCKSGYVREQAMIEAADSPELLSLILGGFNDNVRQVRSAAERSFDKALDILSGVIDGNPEFSEFFSGDVRPKYEALAVIFRTRAEAYRISRCGRYAPESLKNAADRLDGIIYRNSTPDTVKALAGLNIKLLIGRLTPDDRFSAYRAMADKGLLTWETVKEAANCEYVITDKIYFLASRIPGLSREQLTELSDCGCKPARSNAVCRLFEEYGLWEGSERALTDNFSSVRETAVYYYEKLSNKDLYGFYLSLLPSVPAMGGLALCCRSEEQRTAAAAALLPIINSGSSASAAAAVYSLAVIKPDGELFYRLISDPRPRVSKTALKAFLKSRETIECSRIYNDIMRVLSDKDNALSELTARRLTSALLGQPYPTAKTLVYALRLCAAENEQMRCRAAEFVVGNLNAPAISQEDKEKLQTAFYEIKKFEPLPFNREELRLLEFILK